MIPVTFNSAPAFLLDDLPDWASPMQLDVVLPVATAQGLNALEDRRPQGDTARLSIGYTAVLQAGSVPVFRNSLQAWTTEPILCPLWPAWFDAGTTPPVTSAFYVLMDDTAAPSIQAAAGLPFSRPAYPLMVGRLTETPNPNDLISDVEAFVEISFTENDASSITPPVFAPATSLAAANGVRPLFPFRPDWSTSPESGGAAVDIDRQNIGQLRSTADAFYPQPARRMVTQGFILEASDAWNLLSFWLTQGAERENFWVPASISEAALTADVGAGDTALTVDVPSARGNNVYAVLDDLNNRVAVQITGTAGNAWNLSGAVGTAFVALNTRIESLMLGRFDGTKLSLVFEDLDVVTCRLKFKELPLEAVGASVETIGSTMGPLPTSAWLYVFTINYPGGAQVWRYTSFERNLTNGGNTYTAINIESGDITETATLERQTVTLKARNFAGSPLALVVPFTLEWPLLVDIYEADVATIGGTAATNLKCYFSGEINSCDTDGPYLNATAASLSHWFDRQIPRRIYQTGCNWILFEPKCGLLAANWKWQGVVTAWNATTSVLTLGTVVSVASPLNTATLAAHFFAGGYMTIGAGTGIQYRMVTDSTAVSGAALSLTVSTAFKTAPQVGDVVSFFPGCDGDRTTCGVAKFNNFGNFGGFPFVPASNPTIAQQFTLPTGTKK